MPGRSYHSKGEIMAVLDLRWQFLNGTGLKILSKELGSRPMAIGTVIEFWELAKEYWVKDESLIPMSVFKAAKFPMCLLDPALGFAEIINDEIYAKGSRDNFGWMIKRKEYGRKGGIASGKSRRANKINKLDNINVNNLHLN